MLFLRAEINRLIKDVAIYFVAAMPFAEKLRIA